VRFLGSSRAPALTLAAGATAVELRGLEFVVDGGDAIVASAGARAAFFDCRVTGACDQLLVADGARLAFTGLIGSGRIAVRSGDVSFDSCSLAAQAPVLSVHQASVNLARTRIAGTGDAAVVVMAGGEAVLDAVAIEGPSAAIGLDVVGGAVTVRDVAVSARGIGVRCEGATVALVDGLTVHAGEIGIGWSGTFQRGWRWFNLGISATEPHRGLDPVAEALVGAAGSGGARQQRLRQIPVATP
jgi:hypothetical protein